MSKESEMEFIDRISEYIDLESIKTRTELNIALEKALKKVRNQPSLKQKNILYDYLDLEDIAEYNPQVEYITIKYWWGMATFERNKTTKKITKMIDIKYNKEVIKK